MCTHNVCFERKYLKKKSYFSKQFPFVCFFFRLEKSLYIAWASFHNVYKNLLVDFCVMGAL